MPAPVKTFADYFQFPTANGNGSETAPSLRAMPNGRLGLAYIAGSDVGFASALPGVGESANTLISPAVYSAYISQAFTPAGFRIVAAQTYAGPNDIYVSIYGPSTGATGATLVNNVLLAQRQTDVWGSRLRAVALDEDSFLVTWNEDDGLALRGAVINAGGRVERAPFLISAQGATFPGAEVGLTVLTDGNAVVSYLMLNGNAAFRIVTPTGFATAEIDYDGLPGGNALPTVAALADGRFAIVAQDSNGGFRISGRIFNPDGSLSVPAFEVFGAGNSIPEAIGLPDGRFFVIVENTGLGELLGQMMKPDGTKDGGLVAINTVTAGTQRSVDMTLTADGRIAIAWQTDEQGNNDIKLTILDPREAGIDLIGTSLDDIYVGSAFADTVATGGGNDVVDGAGGDDFLVGGAGNDDLRGGGGNDDLRGGYGNDGLDGGTGADRTEGGTGDDVHVVDDLGDTVVEAAGQGNDRVLATASWRLNAGAAVELIAAANLMGTSALDLAGNELAQLIIGNDGANNLDGLGGNDTLYGLGGNDSLDGGAGGDTMFGGGGDDIYVIDDLGDQAIDLAGEGNDRVLASVNFQLGASRDIELIAAFNLAGTGALDLIGNEFAQIVIGNDGANNLYGLAGIDTLHGLAGNDALDGGAGGDTMFGGAGDDVYVVDDLGDQAIEAAGEGGNDRVLTSVGFQLGVGSEIELIAALNLAGTGALILIGNDLGQIVIGNAGINNLMGLAGNDTLFGLEGDDVLDGGTGNDMLDGGAGADQLVFSAALEAGNIDQVFGFVTGVDRILLDDAVFAGLGPGALPASAFVIGAAATDSNDRIVYDPGTGALVFDADGNGSGAAVQFAALIGAPVLTAGDFQVI